MKIDQKIRIAQNASGEDLWKLVRDSHPDVILNVALNKNLTEEMAVFLAKKKSTPSEVLGLLANDIRFKDSYKLKLSICKNPKTPEKITFSILKFLRIFDLGDMTRDQNLPVNVRQKIEYSIYERIPSMPAGNKIALSKRANSNIVVALMERGDKKVISECLASPTLTEGHICKVINRKDTKPLLVKMIAENQKWSLRYSIKYALTRNYHTPMIQVSAFIKEIKTSDLKDLYSDSNLPASTKPFIYRELLERNETVEIDEEETFELSEDDDTTLMDPDIHNG